MMHVPVRRPKVPVVRIEAYVFKCRIRGGGGLYSAKRNICPRFHKEFFLRNDLSRNLFQSYLVSYGTR